MEGVTGKPRKGVGRGRGRRPVRPGPQETAAVGGLQDIGGTVRVESPRSPEGKNLEQRQVKISDLSPEEMGHVAKLIKVWIDDEYIPCRSSFLSAASRRLADLEKKVVGLYRKMPYVIASTNIMKRVTAEQQAKLQRMQNALEHFGCPMCMKRLKSVVLNCGHTFCSLCSNTIYREVHDCPMCHTSVTRGIPLY